MDTRWKPNVTVAGIIEKDGRFLLVEEDTPEGLRLNNPAGHLEIGESPVQACIREVLEETAYPFIPSSLLGIYLSRTRHQDKDLTYLRIAFCGQVGNPDSARMLDQGIVRALWLDAQDIRGSTALHRSPLVLQCMEDFLLGQRFPLSLVYTDTSVMNPFTEG